MVKDRGLSAAICLEGVEVATEIVLKLHFYNKHVLLFS